MFVDTFRSRLVSNNKRRLAWRPSYLLGAKCSNTTCTQNWNTFYVQCIFFINFKVLNTMEQRLWGHQSYCGRVHFRTQCAGDGVIKEYKLSGNRLKIPVWQSQALACRPFTARRGVLSQASPSGICGRRSSAGTGFCLSTFVWPLSFFTRLPLTTYGVVNKTLLSLFSFCDSSLKL